ncbi:TPA: DJ-1/PfpI family protein [Candidatus Micrarchaeota archaeon]|nr:DJ-1/PfpI family protein [Candidatus Micrarchaeota archaeon]
MAKVLMIIAQEGFRDEEYQIPRETIEKAGHSVKVASITRSKATGKFGAVVQPDLAVHEANPEYFDAIVVVGGPGAKALADNAEVINLLEKANLKGKKICAICVAPMILAKAGVLSGKNATVFPDREAVAELRAGGALYREQNVVTDGNVVTAKGPEAAEEFGREVVKLLVE